MNSSTSTGNRGPLTSGLVLPRDWKEGVVGYCEYCQKNVVKESKHCMKCNRCIKGFDHHCRFINLCIGELNYHWFLTLVVCILLDLVCMLAVYSGSIAYYGR